MRQVTWWGQLRVAFSVPAAVSQGGETLTANVLRQLAKGKDLVFADRGQRRLKGFDDHVRLYEVRWEG